MIFADDQSVKKLDDSIWKTENERIYEDSFYPAVSMPIRVYIYEMPSKFTYDLLWLFRNSYKETSNLTSNGSPVHRLIEQVTSCTIFCRLILHVCQLCLFCFGIYYN